MGWGSGLEEQDRMLIRLAKQGDAQAFTQLVHNYKQFVWQIALGVLGDWAEAEDVTQEAFVRAYRSLPTLRTEETFPSWLATVTTRLAIDVARRKKGHRLPQSAPDEWLEDPVDRYGTIENRLLLTTLLERLSEDERAILILRELEDKSYQEIANVLQIPIGTVRSRLHNARLALKHMISSMERENES